MSVFRNLFGWLGKGNVGDDRGSVGRDPIAERLARIQAERQRMHTKPAIRPPSPSKQRLDERLGRVQRDRERGPGQSLTAKLRAEEEAAKRKREDEQAADPEYRFLHMGEAVYSPVSTNVAMFWFEESATELFVQYKDGSLYKYTGVTTEIARKFYRRDSKGKAVWDYLRIRGTSLGHQHPYYLVSGPQRGAGQDVAPGFGTRKWEETPESAKAHGQKVLKQSSSPRGFAADDPLWREQKKRKKK